MTEETVIDPKLIQRLKKMWALAKDGAANEGEAANATEMARKLMMENNISMAQIDSMGAAGEEGSKRSKTGRKGNAMYKFQQTLMAACAEVNFVYQEVRYEYPNGHRRAKGYILIGRESNIVATQVLFDYLASTCENLGIAYVDYDNRRRMSIEALSFKEGCADRLAARLQHRHEEQLREQKREASERNAAAQHPSAATGTALTVVMEDYAQTEADRNEDLRLNRPEGKTAHLRLVATREHELRSIIRDALRPHRDIGDEHFLREAARVAVEAHCENRGWDIEEMLKRVDYSIKIDVGNHAAELAERQRVAALTPAQLAREQAKADKAQRDWEKKWQSRSYRSSAGPQRNIDGYAYRAGSSAANSVGLDKQVDAAPKGRLS